MNMNSRSVERDEPQHWPSPVLFQAPDQMLDLVTLQPDDPVVVSIFPCADVQPNEQYIASFGEVQKPYTVVDPNSAVFDVLFEQCELPPIGQAYEVSYVFRGLRSKDATIQLTDSSSDFVIPRLHLCNLYGTYAAGLLDTWVASASYRLSQEVADVRPVDDRLPGADSPVIAIGRRAAGTGDPEMLGNIAYSAGHGVWTISIDKAATIAKGDLLYLEMPEPQPGETTWLGFAACV
jgi:hypothetical protein